MKERKKIMRFTLKKSGSLAVAAATVSLGLLTGLSGVASAATTVTSFPNASYGFDGNANLIVGGGSTTLYKMAQGFADLYNSTASCSTNNASYDSAGAQPIAYPQTAYAFNQCDPTTQNYTGVTAGGNYDGDTVAIAASVGSSTGIASINGSHSGTAGTYAYEGTNADLETSGDPNAASYDGGAVQLSNGYGTVDFGLSSRAAKTSGGNCNIANPTTQKAGDELQCDTFWGVAADGVQVFTWGSTVGSNTDSTTLSDSTINPGSGATGMTASDLYNIWECNYTTWGQIPGYTATAGNPPANAPIVPWSMNSNSGTYADFNNFVAANNSAGNKSFTMDDETAEYTSSNPGGTATSPTAPTGKCARELTGSNPLPLENDIKPLLTDVENNQGGLSQDPMSTNNPANWIWAGSNGLLTAYSYLSNPALFGNQYNTNAVPVTTGTGNGQVPTQSNVLSGAYPIPRILSLVTAKTTADCPVVSGVCNFSGGPVNENGTTDLNINGASSGSAGAVKEFIRFLCRTKAENQFTANGTTQFAPTDPYTGVAEYTEIGNVIGASGFTLPPTFDRSAGSNCDVQSVG
jgi:hypothetical protein